MYILPPSISKKIEGYRWQRFTPPAAGKSRRFRGLICHRRSHVVAVGEVKAAIDGPKLEDSFGKIASVKVLRRHWEEFQPTVSREKRYRNYGIAANIVGIRSMNEHEEREQDEIFGFVLAGTSKLKPESLVPRYENRARNNGAGSCPNVLATMDGAYWRPFVSDGAGRTISKRSFHTGNRIGYYEGVPSFSHLIDELYEFYRYAHTAQLAAFRRYLLTPDDSQPRDYARAWIHAQPLASKN